VNKVVLSVDGLTPGVPESTVSAPGITGYASLATAIPSPADFVDLVAQAVIDKIEERERLNGLASMVIDRVFALQKEEREIDASLKSKRVCGEATAPKRH